MSTQTSEGCALAVNGWCATLRGAVSEVLKERIRPALSPDRGLGAVAGPDLRRVVQGEQAVLDGLQELMEIAARQVGATDAAAEEGIAGEEDVPHVARDVEAETP